MEHILIGIDAESASQVAVDWVIRRARHKPVEIRLATALDVFMSDPLDDEALLDQTKRRIEDAVPGIRVTTALIDGSVMEALVAQSRTSDLMVVGYHRKHPLQSLISGALPARLAARAFCATVIVPEDWTPRDGFVVVGIGDDDTAATAVEFAAREASHPRRDLEVVHAWRLPAPSWDAVAALVASADDLQAAHQRILEEAVRNLRDSYPALTIRETLSEGWSPNALMALTEGAELVVIGTHRRGPVSGLLLGSTALDLLPRSRTPLCIVPLVAPLTPAGGVLATIAPD